MAKAHTRQVKAYYHSLESIVGYRLMTQGVKHFGYHPDPAHPLTLAEAQLAEDDLVAHRLGVKPGAKILECGCGEGSAANFIAQAYGLKVTGIDLLPRNVARATKTAARLNTGALFQVGDYMRLPFTPHSFAAIYAMETLVHAPDTTKLFGELYRVLEPGGKLVFCEYSMTPRDRLSAHAAKVVTTMNTYSHMPALEDFTTGAFPALLASVGFRQIHVTDITPNFMPTLEYFYRKARTPNKLIKRLHLERHFINTYSAAEIYSLHAGGEDVIQYNLVEAQKPMS